MSLTYQSLLFVTTAAVLSPWLSTRLFRGLIPAVVIEILFGIALGPSYLHLASSTQYVGFMANFGFSYLMFLSGLELDFDLLMARPAEGGQRPWVRGLAFYAVVFVLSLLVGYGLSALHIFGHPFVTALVLSTTSTGIVTPTLKAGGWLGEAFGQEVLMYALVADLASLFLITGYVAVHTSGNAFSVLLVMVLLLVFVVIYRGLRTMLRSVGFGAITNATSEMGLRGAFFLILVFLVLAQSLGTQVVVGAFLAGAIVSLLASRHSALPQKLNSIGYGFLLPIFFVNVGLTFHVGVMHASPAYWAGLLSVFVAMYLVKTGPTAIFMRRFMLRQRYAAGMLLSAGLSLVVALSQIGVQIHVLSEADANGFIVLAITTCLLSPALWARALRGVPGPMDTGEALEAITLDARTLPAGWTVERIEVRSRRVNGTAMRHLRLPQDLLFVSVIRGEERIIPRGNTVLEQFDIVQVMGDPLSIARVRDLLQRGQTGGRGWRGFIHRRGD